MAAELDKAVEIDSYPDRQDLSLDLVRLAGKSGCRISIGTDAHGSSQLRFIDYGLASALKARIDSTRILNFMHRDELLDWLARPDAVVNPLRSLDSLALGSEGY